jgi:pimeloyl-[acyl-carrier protein] methyl ester esterase
LTGAGPDVAFLHGWALNGSVFGPLCARLAASHRTHTLDLPGHGRSPWSKGSADLEGLARRVAEHLPERCSLVGWSLGGLVAVRIATLFPERVSRLVLIASSPCPVQRRGWPHGLDEPTLAGIEKKLARDWRTAVLEVVAIAVKGDERQLDTLRELRRYAAEHGEPSPAALAAGLAVLRATDLRGELGRVRAPTLVIGGAEDRMTPPAAVTALAGGIPQARLELIPGAAHAPFLSHRDRVDTLIADFLVAP